MLYDSPSSKSLENLFRIRPVGVVSKKRIGDRNTLMKTVSCMLDAALSVLCTNHKYSDNLLGKNKLYMYCQLIAGRSYTLPVEIRAVLFWLFPKTVNLPPKPVGLRLTFIQ